MSNFDLATAVPGFIVVLLSLTVHEFSHAWSAYRLGDDTAARLGRMTLNPLPHIDLIGTIVVPLVLTVSGIPPIGWAKPVPVDPAKFRRGVRVSVGDTLVSLAGPTSNLLLALLAAILLGVYLRFDTQAMQQATAGSHLLLMFVEVNVVLAIFNVVPVPPLDGSHLLGHVLPREAWEPFRRIGPILLLALLYIPAGPGGGPILWKVLGPAEKFLVNQLLRISATLGLA